MCLKELLKKAKEAGASDVHITTGIPPKMRVRDELVNLSEEIMSPDAIKEAVYEVMSEEQRGVLEKKGSCDFSFAVPGQGRYRVNAFKQRGSIAVAVRLVSWDIPSADELGIPEAFLDLYDKKKGIVIVTGPSGSGRSTTQATFIAKVNENRNCHVVTLEDPIEFLHQHKKAIVNQRELGIDVKNFEAAISDAMRENADVVMLGNIGADYEGIDRVLSVAESGKLVLASAHEKSVLRSIERLLDVFPEERQRQIRVRLSRTLRAIVAQQLLPAMDGGMVAAFEVLIVNDEVRELIKQGKIVEVNEALKNKQIPGSCTMDQAIVQLFYDGKIDREVAVSYAHEPEIIEDII